MCSNKVLMTVGVCVRCHSRYLFPSLAMCSLYAAVIKSFVTGYDSLLGVSCLIAPPFETVADEWAADAVD